MDQRNKTKGLVMLVSLIAVYGQKEGMRRAEEYKAHRIASDKQRHSSKHGFTVRKPGFKLVKKLHRVQLAHSRLFSRMFQQGRLYLDQPAPGKPRA